jgi:hypothetical protein
VALPPGVGVLPVPVAVPAPEAIVAVAPLATPAPVAVVAAGATDPVAPSAVAVAVAHPALARTETLGVGALPALVAAPGTGLMLAEGAGALPVLAALPAGALVAVGAGSTSNAATADWAAVLNDPPKTVAPGVPVVNRPAKLPMIHTSVVSE